MGQRSQIYVMITPDKSFEGEPKDYLIANYYQWNFADRMVSRLRSFVARMEVERCKYMDEKERLKFANFLDYNPDYHDMVMHSDVIEEAFKRDTPARDAFYQAVDKEMTKQKGFSR